MNANLNELELLKMAQGVEEEGLRFYTEAMNNAKDEKTKEIFKMLAQEEDEHAKLFSSLFDYASKNKDINNEDYIYDEHIQSYLKALSDTALFNVNGLTNERIRNVKDSKEALLIGIQAEKDAILFYTKFLEVCKLEDTKPYLKKLISEENLHLEKLMNIYKTL